MTSDELDFDSDESVVDTVSRVRCASRENQYKRRMIEALGCLHAMRGNAKFIGRFANDPNLDLPSELERIQEYGQKMHVLLGGLPATTYDEACKMVGFPECESDEYNNRTPEENRDWLLKFWGYAS